jgi:hypothetical protein
MATVSFSTAFIADVMSRLTLTTNVGERLDAPGQLIVVVVPFTGTNDIPNAWSSSVGRPHAFGGIFADSSPLLAYESRSGNNENRYTSPTVTSAAILFRNSSGTTLASYTASELTRTIDAEGYCVLSNFPPKTPVAAGTISDIYIRTDTGAFRTLTLTVGAPNSAADVQFDDRVLVTNQPWRLDGSIKFRVPMSYEFTT